jgi:hypothetical protein
MDVDDKEISGQLTPLRDRKLFLDMSLSSPRILLIDSYDSFTYK